MSLKLAVDNGSKHVNNMSADELSQAMSIAANLPFDQRSIFYEKLVSPSVPALQGEVTAPYWLLSAFDENIWECQFSKKMKKTIDFNVHLDDGHLLTDDKPMHRKLLYTLKYWLCTQSHPRFCGGNLQTQVTSYNKVLRCLNIFDILLLNSEHFKLSKFGLYQISANDAIAILARLKLGVAEGGYEFTSRVNQHLKNHIEEVTDEEVGKAIKKYPDISLLPKERYLELTDDELIRSRVWLLSCNAYENPNSYGPSGNCRNNFFLQKIYRDTLTGQTLFAQSFKELRVSRPEHETEYRAVPVNNQDDDGMGINGLRRFIATFKSLSIVIGDKFAGVSPNIMHNLNIESVEIVAPYQGVGRYRSLPAQLAFTAIKDSFEFALEYADDIFQAVAHMVIWEHAQPKWPKGKVEHRDAEVVHNISRKLSALGVCRWRLLSEETINAKKRCLYFGLLRNNVGLYELYEVLMGCIQISIGILMARRQGELIDLSSDCLQPNTDPHLQENKNTGYNLIFCNRKSGDGEDREILSRPIMHAGAKLVWKMRIFWQKLYEAKCIKSNDSMLLAINQNTIQAISIYKDRYNDHLDTFCDYTETIVINQGRENEMRYYFRQHQLRRFFAMTFFWSSGFDGLDTLRYFLGHTDAEHLYHYITESIPGLMLRSVKADKLVSSIERNEIVNIDNLRELLKQRFGVDTISIKSVEATLDELSEEVESGLLQTDPPLSTLRQQLDAGIHLLMEEGTIDLQPEFFTVINAAGEPVQDFRLVLIVREVDDEDQ